MTIQVTYIDDKKEVDQFKVSVEAYCSSDFYDDAPNKVDLIFTFSDIEKFIKMQDAVKSVEAESISDYFYADWFTSFEDEDEGENEEIEYISTETDMVQVSRDGNLTLKASMKHCDVSIRSERFLISELKAGAELALDNFKIKEILIDKNDAKPPIKL